MSVLRHSHSTWCLRATRSSAGITQRSYSSNPYSSIRASKALLWTCIGANVLVFGAWSYAGQETRTNASIWARNRVDSSQTKLRRLLQENFLLNISDVKEGKFWTLLTSAFSHKDAFHILGNMISLHTFATVLIYSAVPTGRLASVLIGSAIAGSVGFIAQQQTAPYGQRTYGLGASGIVMGVGTAAAMLRPQWPIQIVIVPAPLWVAVLGYLAYDTYFLDNPASRTGHAAHLGGAAFGALYYTLFLRRFGGVFGSSRFR